MTGLRRGGRCIILLSHAIVNKDIGQKILINTFGLSRPLRVRRYHQEQNGPQQSADEPSFSLRHLSLCASGDTDTADRAPAVSVQGNELLAGWQRSKLFYLSCNPTLKADPKTSWAPLFKFPQSLRHPRLIGVHRRRCSRVITHKHLLPLGTGRNLVVFTLVPTVRSPDQEPV